MILVLDRKGSILRHKAGVLYIERQNQKVQSVPVNQLEQVVVYGNALVETSVWLALADAAVPVAMLALRGAPKVAMLGSGLATQLPLRKRQHRLAEDPEARLQMAKWFLNRKFASYKVVLNTFTNLYDRDKNDSEEFKTIVSQAESQLKAANSINSAMGIEGRVSQAWFALLARHLPYKWKFSGRNRRPPRDPINGLLSLGYTLLLSEVRQGILIAGFDPSLGFLHQDYPGRESLALDFMEVFRTGVDNFVLKWINETKLDSTSFFYRKDTGCRLSKKARPMFFSSWATYRENWPRLWDEEDRYGPLRELINGQTAQARQYMKLLEK